MAKGITLQEVDSTATDRLVIKDSAGRAKVSDPSAADDIALKRTVDNAVGNLSTLQTTDKSNVVKAINELFTNVSDGKNAVAAAITDKGVSASGSDTFAQLSTKIGQIAGDMAGVSAGFADKYNFLNSFGATDISTFDKSGTIWRIDKSGNSSKLGVVYKYDKNNSLIATIQLVDPAPTGSIFGSFACDIAVPWDGSCFYILTQMYVGSPCRYWIQKYNTSGSLIWSVQVGDDSTTNNALIATNTDGSLVGTFGKTAGLTKFYNGSGTLVVDSTYIWITSPTPANPVFGYDMSRNQFIFVGSTGIHTIFNSSGAGITNSPGNLPLSYSRGFSYVIYVYYFLSKFKKMTLPW